MTLSNDRPVTARIAPDHRSSMLVGLIMSRSDDGLSPDWEGVIKPDM